MLASVRAASRAARSGAASLRVRVTVSRARAATGLVAIGMLSSTWAMLTNRLDKCNPMPACGRLGFWRRYRRSPTRTIFIVLVPPDLPIGSPIVSTIRSPRCTWPLSTSRSSAARSTLVAVAALLEVERVHVAVERHLALRRDLRRQRVDRAAAVVARHPQRGRARTRVSDAIAFTFRWMRGEQRGHRDRLVDARERAVEEIAVELDRRRTSRPRRRSAPSSRPSRPDTGRWRSRPRA